MSRFKWVVVLIHALTGSFYFLPFYLSLGLLFLSSLLLIFYINHFFDPLQRLIEGQIPNPMEKNAFSSIALQIHSLQEKMKEGKIQTTGQVKDLEAILNTLNEGILAFNVRSKITFVNEKACQLLGHSKNELMGRSLLYFERFHQKCHDLVLHSLQTAESIHKTWSENGISLDLVAAPFTHQEGALLVIQDKTSDYKMVEMGKSFIANASHELRTPITVIRGFAEMLQEVPSHEISDKIIRTCDRLEKLVKSLLELTGLENVTADRFKPCHISTLFENCKHLFQSAHPEIQLVVSPFEDLSVYGDFDLLGSALMNVLENAVKYSGSTIHLKVEKQNEWVNLIIQDQGIGIPKVDLPHIFDRFYTVDKSRSRKLGGVGLGLSIVKLIMEKHRGKVSVESEIGKGSIFTLSIPRA
jgi:two-component system, OmpR family, phosphate regulon sensor histidine kinase PhoR